MNPSSGRDRSSLSADEASAIEAAVRTAVRSILQVFREVNEKRSHCYEAKLSEAERENAALRFQLSAAEHELQTLRQISGNYTISAEVTLRQEAPDEPPACAQSQGGLAIKEEPCSSDRAMCLKSEMADETYEGQSGYPVVQEVQQMCQQTPGVEMWSVQSFSSSRSSMNQTSEKWVPGDAPSGRLKSRECVRRYRERIRADPEKYLAWKEKERLRYQQKRKTINDLSEPMKKLKRMAWREAKRRTRARKQVETAVVQTHVIQTTDPSLRRRKRIQDLPEAMQKQQRKAWREATRRHRARKMAQVTIASPDVEPSLNP